MSLKLIRINDPAQIKHRIREFVDKQINIVLKDNSVVFGKLVNVTEGQISVVNMRLKRTEFPFTDIYELQVDVQA